MFFIFIIIFIIIIFFAIGIEYFREIFRSTNKDEKRTCIIFTVGCIIAILVLSCLCIRFVIKNKERIFLDREKFLNTVSNKEITQVVNFGAGVDIYYIDSNGKEQYCRLYYHPEQIGSHDNKWHVGITGEDEIVIYAPNEIVSK